MATSQGRACLKALCFFGLFVACGPSQPPVSPRGTLDAYADALEQGRLEDAYALLSDDSKNEITFSEFKRIVRENPEEMSRLATELRRPSGPPLVTAIVKAPGGESLLLVYENGQWRVDGSALDLYGQGTPRQAIAAFVRAFENGRYDVLLRFVPDAQRAGLDEETLKRSWQGEQKQDIERRVAALRASLSTAKYEVLGRRATIAYGAGGTVEMLREDGVWKIEELR